MEKERPRRGGWRDRDSSNEGAEKKLGILAEYLGRRPPGEHRPVSFKSIFICLINAFNLLSVTQYCSTYTPVHNITGVYCMKSYDLYVRT